MIQRILRLGRITKYLPYFRGIALLQRFYQFALPKGALQLSVDNFDNDLKLRVDIRDTIGMNVWHRPEFFDKNQRKLFCAAITPGSVVLDVGANVGIYTLLAAKLGARVFAIEADPRNLEMLRYHVHLNGFDDRVTIIPIAVGDQESTVTLFHFEGNCGHSNLFEGTDPVHVPCRKIDSLGLPAIDVCKMDIEGSELGALKGMDETIKHSPKMKMLVEYAEGLGGTIGMLQFICERFAPVYAMPYPPFGPMGPLSEGQKPPRFCDLSGN